MIRKLLVLLIIGLTIYAPVELTRIVWKADGVTANLLPDAVGTLPPSISGLIVELIFIWALYLAAMILVWQLAKEADRVP